MTSSVQVRKIYLDDIITQHNSGISPLRLNQKKAFYYSYLQRALNLSTLGTGAMGFILLTKTHTKRSVYFKGFVSLFLLSITFYYFTNKYRQQLIVDFKCEKENLHQHLEFYRNALLDSPNYFEQNIKQNK